MKDMKGIKNGFAKKGFVCCLAGILAFGMMACGGKDKKDSTKVEVKTEAVNPTDKDKSSTGTTSSTQPKSSTGSSAKPTDKDKSSTGTTSSTQPKSSTGSSAKPTDKKQDTLKADGNDAQKGKTGTESKKETKTQNTQKKTSSATKN